MNHQELGLFDTKEEQLLAFCKSKGYFNSHDVNLWGANHFFDSACRRIREMCEGENPKIKRLDKDEILFRGLWKKGQQHLAWYKIL